MAGTKKRGTGDDSAGKSLGTRSGRRSWGSIERLPSGRFRARVPDPGGRYVSAPMTFTSRADASVWVDLQRADMVRGVWRAPRIVRETVEEYVARWIKEHPTAKASTRELYSSVLRSCIAPEPVGKIALSELRPDDVRAWFHALGVRLERQAVARRSAAVMVGREISDATVQDGRTRQAQAYRLLRAAMTTAFRDGVIRENPCRVPGAGTPRPSVRRTELDLAARLLTPAQIAAIAAAMPPRYSALVMAAAWSGLRQGELLGLQRHDLDLTSTPPVVRVRRRVRRNDRGQVEVDTPKTRASVRVVALPDPLADQLSAHLDRFVAPAPESPVFTTETGTTPARGNLASTLRRAMAQAGVRQVRFHDLRHVAQVLAAENGATMAELMVRMGHASAAAAQVYMHARLARDGALAQRLAEAMTLPPSGS